MINNFIKLNKSSEITLQIILENKEYPMELTDQNWDQSQIEALIHYGYLHKITEENTTDIIGGWNCWVSPTYEGKEYENIKKEYYNERIKEDLKFIFPLIISIIALII